MFKASIIGCGKIAGSERASIETHIGAIASNKKIKLASCYDNDDKSAKIFANKYDCLNEKSISELLLVTQPDIISICTPDKTHFSIIKQVLEKSKKTKGGEESLEGGSSSSLYNAKKSILNRV